jgi:excisionase family DNA binding protein
VERLLSAAELAEVLGFAAGTVVDWSARGELPAFKLGGKLRFRESEVLAWLEERRQGRLTPASNPAAGGVVYVLPASTKEAEHAR